MLYLSGQVVINQWNFTINNVGLNRLVLDQKQRVHKGSLIVIDCLDHTARVGIDSNGNSLYSDYKVTNKQLKALANYTNMKFLFNSMVDGYFYESIQPFGFLYQKFDAYNISATLTNSVDEQKTIHRQIVVSNCNF